MVNKRRGEIFIEGSKLCYIDAQGKKRCIEGDLDD